MYILIYINTCIYTHVLFDLSYTSCSKSVECCSVLQCVAVSCSVLQCVAMCRNVLDSSYISCSKYMHKYIYMNMWMYIRGYTLTFCLTHHTPRAARRS